MKQRVLTAVILGPIVILGIARGGWLFTALTSLALSIAAVEWVQLAALGGLRASGGLIKPIVWLFLGRD
jgi:CDP-diglyceride synthetase